MPDSADPVKRKQAMGLNDAEQATDRKSLRFRLINPDAHQSDARTRFMGTIESHAPEVIEDLVTSVQPIYLESYRACDAPPDFVFSPIVPAVSQAIEDWCARWHLLDTDGAAPWLIGSILHSLWWRTCTSYQISPREWGVITVSYCRMQMVGSKDIRIPPAHLNQIRLPEYDFLPDRSGESLAQTRESILRDITRRVDNHIATYRQWADEVGVVASPTERSLQDHLRWFVQFQMKGQDLAAICQPYGKGLDRSGVRKALHAVADALGICLRREKTGRKAKTVDLG